MRSYFSEKNILITGGTGSLGTQLVKDLHERSARKLCVLSRSEEKHVKLKREMGGVNVRHFIGDIRDPSRLDMAFTDIDMVIHAAAMKHVDLCEYNPSECSKTNIAGTQNVIDAAIRNNVEKVLFVSSDKAVNPINIYGASKLSGERLVLGAEAYAGEKGTRFAIIRFGNFMWSSGSVLELWKEMYKVSKVLPITSKQMTRIWISLEHASIHCMSALMEMNGGEIFIPKMKCSHLTSIARKFFPECEFEVIGIRRGEKLHEEMIIEDEISMADNLLSRFVIRREEHERTVISQMSRSDFEEINYISK